MCNLLLVIGALQLQQDFFSWHHRRCCDSGCLRLRLRGIEPCRDAGGCGGTVRCHRSSDTGSLDVWDEMRRQVVSRAILAPAPSPVMLTNATAFAISALAFLLVMLTNAAAPTLIAQTPLLPMLTNPAASAILAKISILAMLANPAAPAIFAETSIPAM